MEYDAGLVPVAFGIEPQLFQKLHHVRWRSGLSAVTPRKGEIRFQHTRHFIDVLLHCVDFRRVFDQGEFKLEACKDGAQIVRHPGKHRRTLFHRSLNTGLHLNESGGGTPHFTCAAWTEVRHLTPFTETLCGISQPKDRLDLIAQKNDGDCEQYR